MLTSFAMRISEVNFSPLSRHYTLDELWALPEREDHAHYNLIAGILFVIPPPEPPHGDLVSKMSKFLFRFLITNRVAGLVYHPPEPIYRADCQTYLEPDMFYVSSEQIRVDRASADIVFEVLSESTRMYDRTTKSDTYLALEVGELWLIDPVTETIEVRHRSTVDESVVWEIRSSSRGEHATSQILEGLQVSIDELLQD